MKKLWVRHIKDALHTGFEEHIDLSDYEKATASVREKAFLSRALAALAVQRFTELSAREAAATVVDGTGDNGIDAIAIDSRQRKVIVVQSKWDGSGVGSLGLEIRAISRRDSKTFSTRSSIGSTRVSEPTKKRLQLRLTTST